MSKAVVKKVNQTPAHAFERGAAAYYLQINKLWGFKFYLSKRAAKHTYMLQNLAHSLGCAPAVGKFIDTKITFQGNENTQVYGYMTRHVSKLLYQVSGIARQKAYDKKYAIQKKMMAAGFDCCDMHDQNVAISPSGKVLAIDFSHMMLQVDGKHYYRGPEKHEADYKGPDDRCDDFPTFQVESVAYLRKVRKQNVPVEIKNNSPVVAIPLGC